MKSNVRVPVLLMNSIVVGASIFFPFNVLTAFGDTGMVDTHLRFYRGRGTSKIIRREANSSFRISSPVGTAAVRGTQFRVAIDAERSITETLEGAVGFIQTTETAIPQGFGAAASAASIDTEPLLPAPAWVSIAGDYSPGTELAWDAVAGAARYRVGFYANADARTVVQEIVTDAITASVPVLAPGPYIVAVRGISAADIEGYDADLGIQLATVAPQNVAAAFTQGEVALMWDATSAGGPYTVQVAPEPTFREVDERTFDEGPAAFAALVPGRYFWRIKDATSGFSRAAEVLVRPRTPTLTVRPRGRKLRLAWEAVADAESYRVRIANDADFDDLLLEETVADTSLEHAVPKFGQYHIEVSAVAAGVASIPASAEPLLAPHPWWLIALVLFF